MKRIVVLLTISIVALLLLNGAMAAPTTFDSPQPTPTNTPAINPGPALQWSGGYPVTSQYLTGTVAVSVLLPESDGGIDPSTEDWTTEQISSVINEIEQALSWYELIAPSDAELEFQLEWRVASTPYEPITHDWFDWRTPLIQEVSTTADEKDYLEKYRQEKGTDWAFIIFVVNSKNDADGAFPAGHVGYAFICGPTAVCASRVGPMGQSWLDACVAHEMGHVFCALDQRPGTSPCWKKGGWGWTIPNLNSMEGSCVGTTDQLSIMRYLTHMGNIDWYGMGQLGWWSYYSQTYLPIVLK